MYVINNGEISLLKILEIYRENKYNHNTFKYAIPGNGNCALLAIIKRAILLGLITNNNLKNIIIKGLQKLHVNENHQQQINFFIDKYINITNKEQFDDFLNLFFAANICYQKENVVVAEKSLNIIAMTLRKIFQDECDKAQDLNNDFADNINFYFFELNSWQEKKKALLELFTGTNYIDLQILLMLANTENDLEDWCKEFLTFNINFSNNILKNNEVNMPIIFDAERKHYDLCITEDILKKINKFRNKLPLTNKQEKKIINNTLIQEKRVDSAIKTCHSYLWHFTQGMLFASMIAPLPMIPCFTNKLIKPKI